MIVRRARREAGLTQVELARRLGMTQAAIARLERSSANPTVRTLERVLDATGWRLALDLAPRASSVDETLLREALRSTPAERIAAAERLTAEADAIAASGRRARGAR